MVTLTYPDGKQVHYEYDAASQLIKVIDWENRVTVYDYDKNGRLISTLRPNGTKMTRVYDDAGQLKQQKDIVAATSEVISQFDFSYDAAGNIVKEETSPEVDPNINLDMTYQAANRLATVDDKVVQFDADGNMTQGQLAGELVDLVFDSRNRLIQAGDTVYRYDAENQRIGVNQTQFVVNSQPALSQVLVKEENGQKTFYVYGLGLIGQESNGEYLSYHFDFRGSTVALTDESKQVVERFQYSPYGTLLSGDASKTPFLFNGMYGVMTDESGLYYMRARFYSQEIRRFVNQDVLLGDVFEGQSLNRYAYVTGRPVSFIDPFGLSGKDTIDGFRDGFVGAIIGGGIAAIIVATLPVSGPISAGVMTAIALTGSAAGGFFAGANGYEYFVGEDYWSGEKLTSSEIDYRGGRVLMDAITLGAGCWFRIPTRDLKALSDWEWLKLSPGERMAYDNGLTTVSDELFGKIGKLAPQQRGIDIRNTDWPNALGNAGSGPGPGGRFAWPFIFSGSESCGDCYPW